MNIYLNLLFLKLTLFVSQLIILYSQMTDNSNLLLNIHHHQYFTDKMIATLKDSIQDEWNKTYRQSFKLLHNEI